MAKILVCADGFFRAFSAFGLEPYIEGFINTLVRNGNYVVPYIAKDFEIAGKFRRKYIKRKTNKEILAFNPDLIIAFNNAIDPECICNLTCPILVIASDTPIYWRNKDYIKKNNARYSVAYFNNDMADLLNTEYKIPLNRQILIPYSTDMHANKKIAAKYDISVIVGTPTYAIPSWLVRKYPDISMKMLTAEMERASSPHATHVFTPGLSTMFTKRPPLSSACSMVTMIMEMILSNSIFAFLFDLLLVSAICSLPFGLSVKLYIQRHSKARFPFLRKP